MIGYKEKWLGTGIRKSEHVWLAESALGRELPKGAEVHHANGNPRDNRNENLVICPSVSYHRLLHTRMAAFAECGNANHRKCLYCKEYDDPSNMYIGLPHKGRENGSPVYHRSCKTNYQISYRRGICPTSS